ncbi:MAG: DUF4172 domain-containing protein [Holophaga sp.]|nr:DUF4172 domain-containing protein [Holophaga sp.]
MARATTGHTFIWELQGWPALAWDSSRLAGPLDSARRAQAELLGAVRAIGGFAAGETAVEAMAREVVNNEVVIRAVRDAAGSLSEYAGNVSPDISSKQMKDRAWEEAVHEKTAKKST